MNMHKRGYIRRCFTCRLWQHVQNQTQEEVFKCIDYYSTKTGIKNIIVTGGYGMNIVTNSYIVQMMPV